MPEPTETRTLQILLVCDELEKGDIIRQVLSELNPSITRVATEDDFKAQLAAGSCDLILSGIGNQYLDGFAALAIVRGRHLHTPFIFVAGEQGTKITAQAFRMGAADFVLKEKIEADLLPAVQRVLQRALPGVIPICMYCQNIRDNEDWKKVPDYFGPRIARRFTHSICLVCYDRHIKPYMEIQNKP